MLMVMCNVVLCCGCVQTVASLSAASIPAQSVLQEAKAGQGEEEEEGATGGSRRKRQRIAQPASQPTVTTTTTKSSSSSSSSDCAVCTFHNTPHALRCALCEAPLHSLTKRAPTVIDIDDDEEEQQQAHHERPVLAGSLSSSSSSSASSSNAVSCAVCTFENPADSAVCGMCGADQRASETILGSDTSGASVPIAIGRRPNAVTTASSHNNSSSSSNESTAAMCDRDAAVGLRSRATTAAAAVTAAKVSLRDLDALFD